MPGPWFDREGAKELQKGFEKPLSLRDMFNNVKSAFTEEEETPEQKAAREEAERRRLVLEMIRNGQR